VIAAGGAIYSANKQSGAAQDAANASNAATQASLDEQKREFDINQQNQAPWLNTGKSALNVLAGMYGLNGQGTAGQPDYSAFYQSPDYTFALQQGQQALDRSAAARGSLYSGGNAVDTMNFGQGLASQQFGNFYNRLAGLAGVGQTAANQLGTSGQNYANSVGQMNQWNAQNQMGSIYDKSNANSNMWNQIAGIGGNLAGQFYHPSTSTYQMPQQDFSGGQYNISSASPGTGAYNVFNLG
jgi:hypothetical protein